MQKRFCTHAFRHTAVSGIRRTLRCLRGRGRGARILVLVSSAGGHGKHDTHEKQRRNNLFHFLIILFCLSLIKWRVIFLFDEFGNFYPAYGFNNDDDYLKIQPKDAVRILYGIKANGPLNSKIHGNTYSRINGGLVRFLIKEQEAKNALLSTKQGQKMSVMQRVKRLMPHEMTTKLFEEMANLRLKKTGASMDIVLEQINPRYPKDKYSAFAYGLWRIKELEEEQAKRRRRRNSGLKRQLVFCSGGV